MRKVVAANLTERGVHVHPEANGTKVGARFASYPLREVLLWFFSSVLLLFELDLSSWFLPRFFASLPAGL